MRLYSNIPPLKTLSSQNWMMTRLARSLGLFDATMIVMGRIIGSGIFINPYLVAQQLRSPGWILLAWMAGGWIALSGGLLALVSRRLVSG